MSPADISSTNRSTSSSPSAGNDISPTRAKHGPDLPWWVELLFVQIGLPDRWLRSILKTRKQSKSYLSENKTAVRYFFVALLALIYFYPVVRSSRNYNHCIDSTSNFLKRTTSKSYDLMQPSYRSIANRYCNGGDI